MSTENNRNENQQPTEEPVCLKTLAQKKEDVFIAIRNIYGNYEPVTSDAPSVFINSESIELMQAELTAVAVERNIALEKQDDVLLNKINEHLYDVSSRIIEEFKKLNELPF